MKGSRYRLTLRRNGKIVHRITASNTLVQESMEYFANVMFSGETVGSLIWKFGLIDNDGYTGVDIEDTLSSHPGWTEITDYTRQDWDSEDWVNSFIGTDTPAEWTFTTTGELRGVFLTNGTILLSTAVFSVIEFYPNDTLQVDYTLDANGS